MNQRRNSVQTGANFSLAAVPATGHFIPPVPQGFPSVTPTFAGKTVDERLLDECAGTRILLAEDEPINQKVSRGLLADVGLVVDPAEDGRQALALARRNPYAPILMDMQMPVMNGVEATMAIRELPAYAQPQPDSE
ncbi:MAG: response regulator [Rhodocyclaceae bacterium]|nr:response regulator [Rhodocyclaceae bacterium]